MESYRKNQIPYMIPFFSNVLKKSPPIPNPMSDSESGGDSGSSGGSKNRKYFFFDIWTQDSYEFPNITFPTPNRFR